MTTYDCVIKSSSSNVIFVQRSIKGEKEYFSGTVKGSKGDTKKRVFNKVDIDLLFYRGARILY